MNIGKRIVAGLVLLLAALVLLLSLVATTYLWIVKGPATTQLNAVFGRIEAALDVAGDHLSQVKASLNRASERLGQAREEQRKLARNAQPGSALQRVVARQVLPAIAPDLGTAQEKLHTVAESVIVVNSVLEDLGNFPALAIAGLDVERLQGMNARLVDVAPAAWELSRLFGEPTAASDAAEAQCSRIERALATVQQSITDYAPLLTDARQRVEGLKAWLLPWITTGAILLTLFLLWVAGSQVSVLVHARGWWQAAGSGNAGPS